MVSRSLLGSCQDCSVLISKSIWSSFAVYIFMVLQISYVASQFAIIPPKNPVIGFLGKDVILPCQLKSSKIPQGTSVTLQWILVQSSEAIDVKTYYGGRQPELQDKRYEGRTELFYNELNKGNMSLKLKNSQLLDQGKYTCMIHLGEWYDEVVVELKLTAKGSEPTIALELYEDWGIGLTCSSQGWYPRPSVLWLNSKGENRTENTESSDREQEQGGTFSVSSSTTVEPGVDNGVSCKIIDKELRMESESRILISDVFYPTTDLWLPPFIITLLIDLCLVAFVTYKLRENYHNVYQSVKKKRDINDEFHHLQGAIETEIQTNQASRLVEQSTQHTRTLEELEFRRAQSHAAAFTLDPDYKHPELILSEDQKRIQLKPSIPKNPVTLSGSLLVVGKEGYEAGKHYWEVKVGERLDWELGVLSSAARVKVKEDRFSGPLGEGCWTLSSSRGLFTSQKGEKIEKKDVPYPKIGIFLDQDLGTITFYNAEVLFTIHSIPIQSNEKLYPFLNFVHATEAWSSLEVIHIRVPLPLKAVQDKGNTSVSSYLPWKKNIKEGAKRGKDKK